VFFGSMIAGLVGRLLSPHVQPLLLFVSPIVFGAIGHAIGMMLVKQPLDVAFVEQSLSAMSLPMPVDYAAGSLMGASRQPLSSAIRDIWRTSAVEAMHRCAIVGHAGRGRPQALAARQVPVSLPRCRGQTACRVEPDRRCRSRFPFLSGNSSPTCQFGFHP